MTRHRAAAVALLALGLSAASPARGEGRRTATLHLSPISGRELAARPVAEALQAALARRADLDFTPIEEILEPTAEADKRLAESAAEAARGRVRLDNLEIPEGTAALRRAIDLARSAFPRLAENLQGLNRFAQLLVELAFAHHLGGDRKGCEEALAEAFVLSPKLEFDAKRYPPEMRRVFESTRFLQDELGTGSLSVTTVPHGASVRVNGTLVGYGPVVAEALMAGPNLVSVAKPGYRTTTRAITVEGRKQSRVSVPLSELPGNVAGLLHAALEEARSGAAPSWLPRAAARLQRGLFVLGSLGVRGDVVDVRLHVFDAAAGRIATQLTSKISIPDADRESDSLVASLLARLSQVAVARPAPRGGWIRRVVGWRYFWPVVGGVLGAAAIGTGVGLGVYYGTRGGDRARRFITLF